MRVSHVTLVAWQIDRFGEGWVEHGLLHILRDIDDDWPWATCCRDVEGFFDHAREVFFVQDKKAVLYDRQCHAEKVSFLECSLADELLVHLTSDRYQWDTVHVCICDAGHEIGRTWSTSCHADGCLALSACIAVCHEAATLLHAR